MVSLSDEGVDKGRGCPGCRVGTHPRTLGMTVYLEVEVECRRQRKIEGIFSNSFCTAVDHTTRRWIFLSMRMLRIGGFGIKYACSATLKRNS